ncbi:MAG: MarC family protein [Myxococcales bacterium]|nr:MarC family protein [Myxococcales bacterium]
MLHDFDKVFVPVFVAMSTLTILPIFLAMTEGVAEDTARTMGRRAVLTALGVAVVITLGGQALFRLLGITVDDLRVGGGLILLVLSIHDLLFGMEKRKSEGLDRDGGVVPLGVPMIVGPGTMTTCLVLADSYGRAQVMLALVANLALTALLLENARRLQRYVNPAVTRAFGKVMSLFMAAIAVSMMRAGFVSFFHAVK